MGDYAASLAKTAGAVLEPGERLLAGARGMSAGSTAQIVGGGAGAVAGGAAGLITAGKLTAGGREAGRQAEGDAGLPELPAQLALGLTDQRLLIFRRGSVSGKAKDLVAYLPRESIASVRGEDSGSKLKPDRLHVTLTDESTVTFEVVKNDDVSRLVDAFGR